MKKEIKQQIIKDILEFIELDEKENKWLEVLCNAFAPCQYSVFKEHSHTRTYMQCLRLFINKDMIEDLENYIWEYQGDKVVSKEWLEEVLQFNE